MLPPAESVLLTIAETAARLSCSRMHVYRLIEAGELSTVDIATPGSSQSKSRVREVDLLNYIDLAAARARHPSARG